jgi:DNA polymerase III delta prime subunit
VDGRVYGLEELSDYDFERLVADLLSVIWKAEVDTFPRGRDGGVDLRVLGPTGPPLDLPEATELVVQCKHRPRASFAAIRSTLSSEAKRAIVDQVARYVLVTSARLTRGNKDKIVEIFGGRVSARDVFGRNDVEDLIRRHPEVERMNVKLWLTNSTTIRGLAHHLEHLRSASLIDELMRLRSTFVETPSVREALGRLETGGVCLLVGPPGVGKTTTAHILLLRLAANGWRPATAIAEVRELESQLIPGVKQVLFFDDFLGQNSLATKLVRGEDNELLRLVRSVEQDPTKLLILTTRDYVFRQAQQNYEKLGDGAFSVARVVVGVSALDTDLRGRILYNQLYFSPLREAAARVPHASQKYAQLTRHPNYNPRVVQAAIAAAVRQHRQPCDLSKAGGQAGDGLPGATAAPRSTDGQTDAGVSGLDIPTYLRRALDDPIELWDHILRFQLSDLQRAMLIIRTSFGESAVFLDDLYAATGAYTAQERPTPRTPDLHAALAVLDGDLLTLPTQKARTALTIDAVDPGATDAIIRYLHMHDDLVLSLAVTAISFSQVRWLAALSGLVRGRASRRGFRSPKATVAAIVRAAERTLTSEVSALTGDYLLSPTRTRRSAFYDFGERLSLLGTLYSVSNCSPSPGLVETTAPMLLAGLNDIRDSDLARLLAALHTSALAAWRPIRTNIELAILKLVDEPYTVEGWALLRDVIDEISASGEYEDDLRRQFEIFADDELDQIREAIAVDEDRSQEDSLEELRDLADRWSVFLDLDDLLDEVQERAQMPATHDIGQASLSRDTIRRQAPSVESIFDHL